MPVGTFAAAEDAAGLVNRNYEISPLVADFNDDGYLDIVRVNLAGPSRAFLSGGGTNGFLKVRLPDTPASLGAVVEVGLPGGTKISKQFTNGEGLASDQSHELIFGLANAKSIETVTVLYADGRMKRITPPPSVGKTLRIE
jgi:hypothetical protein